GVDERRGAVAHRERAGALEARASAHVAHVGAWWKTDIARSNDTTASIRGARRAGADVVRGVVVRGAVERGVIDDHAESPVGGAAWIRSAREIELVAQRTATPGTEGQREAVMRDDGRDPNGRTGDRAL